MQRLVGICVLGSREERTAFLFGKIAVVGGKMFDVHGVSCGVTHGEKFWRTRRGVLLAKEKDFAARMEGQPMWSVRCIWLVMSVFWGFVGEMDVFEVKLQGYGDSNW